MADLDDPVFDEGVDLTSLETNLSRIDDGMRKCHRCKKIMPLTEEYFHRDNRNASKFKYTCIKCLASPSKRQVQRDDRVARMLANMDLKMLQALGDSCEQLASEGLPHLAKFAEVGLRMYGGVEGLWQQMYANRLAANPGKDRHNIDMVLCRAITKLSETGAVKIPTELLTDEDLDREIEKKMRLIAFDVASEVEQESTEPSEDDLPDEEEPLSEAI